MQQPAGTHHSQEVSCQFLGPSLLLPLLPKEISSCLVAEDTQEGPHGEKPLQCNECRHCFGSKSSLIKHKKNLHTCPICNSAFSSRGYLGNHFKKVHKQKLFEVEQELLLKSEHQQNIQMSI